MEPWFHRWPERLAHELKRLSDEGFNYKVDDAEREQNQRIVIDVIVPLNSGETKSVRAVFPDSYPYLRPEVYAPDWSLDRHQNPIERNLCLLDRGTWHWSVSDDLAWLLKVQLSKLLLISESGVEAMRAGEAPQGEPFSAWFPYLSGAVILVPDEMLNLPGHHQNGTLEILVVKGTDGSIRGVLSSVETPDQGAIGTADGRLAEWARRQGAQRLLGHWLRVDTPPATKNPKDIIDLVQKAQVTSTEFEHRINRVQTHVSGLLFREEVTQGEYQDGWMFAVRQRVSGETRYFFVRGDRCGNEDIRARVPDLAPLMGASVGIVGLGTLGSLVAYELARSGVQQLRLLDTDQVEAGTAVRWLDGLPAAQYAKGPWLAQRLYQHYPWVQYQAFDRRLGDAPLEPPNVAESAAVSEFLQGIDLVVDATAEYGIMHLISDLALPARLPQVYVWSTAGAWGGVAARCIPGRTGCWLCLRNAIEPDSGYIAPPSGDPSGDDLQPRGCAARTFTGNGFDLAAIANQAVRFAVQTLCAGTQAAYPDSNIDVSVLFLRSEGQPFAVPRWEHHQLNARPGCACSN